MAKCSLTVTESREVDRVAVERLGIPSLLLMENAGRGCADALYQRLRGGPVAVFCGAGNNGGDGLVIARHLAVRGIEVGVLLVPPASKLTGDAATNHRILRCCDVPIVELAGEGGPTAITEALDFFLDEPAEWIVDALLGTGAKGAPRPPYDSIIEWINAEDSRRLAVDVPSGLDADTGAASPTTIAADLTVTFVAAKSGFATPAARPYLGEVVVVDIGVPLDTLLPHIRP
jgi:NAD(P)H-hydrate epimerase